MLRNTTWLSFQPTTTWSESCRTLSSIGWIVFVAFKVILHVGVGPKTSDRSFFFFFFARTLWAWLKYPLNKCWTRTGDRSPSSTPFNLVALKWELVMKEGFEYLPSSDRRSVEYSTDRGRGVRPNDPIGWHCGWVPRASCAECFYHFLSPYFLVTDTLTHTHSLTHKQTPSHTHTHRYIHGELDEEEGHSISIRLIILYSVHGDN